MLTKKCSKCGIAKPKKDFYCDRRTPNGLQSKCKDCSKESVAKWQKDNPDRVKHLSKTWRKNNPQAHKKYDLKEHYKLSLGAYDEMLVLQSWECPICGASLRGRRAAHVDHDHSCCPVRGKSCGKCIRSVLCHRCNTVLGRVRDDVSLLERMAAYLRGYSEPF